MRSSVHKGVWATAAIVFMTSALAAQFQPPQAPATPVVPEGQPQQPAAPGAVSQPQAGSRREPERLFVVEPRTPAELFEATVLAVNLGKVDLARTYLERLVTSQPDDQTLFEIHRKHGTAAFLRLANLRELQPLADQLRRRTLEAARRMARDPARIAELISLLSASPSERAWAIVELRGAGPYAVPPLLAVLQSPERGREHGVVRYALANLERDAVPALVGALGTGDAALKIQVIDVLGEIGDGRAVAHLWSPAALERETAQVRQAARRALERLTGKAFADLPRPATMLLAEARRHEQGRVSFDTDAEGMVELWQWDGPQSAPVPMRLSPRQAAETRAAMFARQALELSPQDPEIQVHFLTMALARDAAVAGMQQPLPSGAGTAYDLALASGPQLVSRVLRQALQGRQSAVALAATRALGEVGEESLLRPSGKRTSLLVEALRYPERRVQFAAAEAILGLRPSATFPGASEVVDVLARSVDSGGVEKSLVADSQVERGQRLAGMVRQLGYSTEIAATGREAFEKAAASADYDLILLDLNILRWNLGETLANLQGDSRTAGIPVRLVGPLNLAPQVRHYEEQYRQVKFVVRPAKSQDLGVQLESAPVDKPDAPLTAEERREFAQRAVSWLAKLAQGELRAGDPLKAEAALRDALQHPDLAPEAVQALGHLASRESQRALAHVLLDNQQPAELRYAAAARLSYSLRKFGLLLGRDQLAGLHQLHDTADDPSLHAAVAAVIGCLAPDAKLAGTRLQRYRLPRATAPEAPPEGSSETAPPQSSNEAEK